MKSKNLNGSLPIKSKKILKKKFKKSPRKMVLKSDVYLDLITYSLCLTDNIAKQNGRLADINLSLQYLIWEPLVLVETTENRLTNQEVPLFLMPPQLFLPRFKLLL
jgi:hypothetical protein